MSEPQPRTSMRVRWRERQTLRAADLAAEQSYREAGRSRHQTGAHRAGVTAGLGLALSPAGLSIGPGTAVDPEGGTLVLGAPQTVPFETLLAAFERLARPGPRGDDEVLIAIAGNTSGDCGDCRLRLSSGLGAAPVATVTLGAYHVGQGVLSLRLDRRARAGLVAQQVDDPAGRARLTLHPEPSVPRLTLAAGDGVAEPAERLRIDADRSTHWSGDALTTGRTSLAAAAGGGAQRLHFTPLAATPAEARPWSLYRTDFQALDDAGSAVGPPRPQLRFEVGPPGEDGDPIGYLFAVGRRGEAGFAPCLRLDSEATLTVGDLRLEGQLVEGPIRPDPNDPDYAAAAATGYWTGVGAAAGQTAAVEISVEVESPEINDGEDLAFDVLFRNAGPALLTGVEVTSRLVPRDGFDPERPLISRSALPAGAVGTADGVYATPSPGSYDLVVSVVATAPGLIPVTDTTVQPITVQVIPG